MNFSISIGIDQYLHLNDTPFAENDARGFHNIMENIYNIDFSTKLLRTEATYSNIKRSIKDISSRIEDGDKFFFFFAGHGENINNKPFISCFDTYPTEANTWLSIIEIIESISENGCNKNLFFIDACQSTIQLGSRKNTTKFSAIELENNALENKYSSVFSSTSHKGVADINTTSKHGIWSDFLLRALSGEDEKALSPKLWLTNNTLQNYLSISVKQYCKSDPKITVQNSYRWGKEEGEFIIYKFQKKEISEYKTIPSNAVDNILFTSTSSNDVKRLPGFKKGSHSIPKYYSSHTENFIYQISADDIEEHIEETSQKLRELFGLKSKDFDLIYEDGRAIFECPYFTYIYRVELNKDDLSEVFFIAELFPTNIEKIIEYSDNFDECFPQWFRYLVYNLNNEITIDELIEKFESIDEDVFLDCKYEYNSSKTHLSIYYKSLNRTIVISEDKIEIKFQVKETIPNMVDELKNISNQLLLVSNDYKLLD